MANWGTGPLGSIAIVEMGQSPTGADVNRDGVGVALLNGPTEFGRRHPTPGQWTTNAPRLCRASDVLFCVRGSTTGRMNQADQPYAIGRGLAAIRGADEGDSRFLQYAVEAALPGLLAGVTGSTFPNLSRAQLLECPIHLPPADVRRAIAEVLGALDNKIATSDRELVTAEALMVALAGKNRQVTKVSALAAQSTRAIKPTEFPERVAHFSLPAFDDGKLPDDAARDSIKSNKFLLSEPCVLMSKLNPRIPRIWNVGVLPEAVSVASTEFVVLVPQGVSPALLWAALSAPQVSTQLEGLVAGTSGSHQRVRPAEMLDVDVPDPRLLDEWTRESVTALGALTQKRRLESQQLARTRDELLPLLMSGKVNVKDAEKSLEGAL